MIHSFLYVYKFYTYACEYLVISWKDYSFPHCTVKNQFIMQVSIFSFLKICWFFIRTWLQCIMNIFIVGSWYIYIIYLSPFYSALPSSPLHPEDPPPFCKSSTCLFPFIFYFALKLLILWVCLIRETMRYLIFCVWLISLSIVVSKCFHFLTNGSNSTFFLAE